MNWCNKIFYLSVIFRYALLCGLVCQIISASPESPDSIFSNLVEFKSENNYKEVLAAMPVQLDAGGAKVIKMKDGSLWIIGIGSTIINPPSGAEITRRTTVARAKAQAYVVAEINGTRVKAVSVMTSSDKITLNKDGESGSSEETLDEKIITEAKGVISGMPIVATWLNQDRNLYFVAIGTKLK